MRLRTDSPYTDRKADLSITLEQVAERTRKKDEKRKDWKHLNIKI